jgi:hypothetical protein
MTNPWAKGSRPPQRHVPHAPTWNLYSPEDEDDYEQPEPDVYELAILAAAEARLADEADLNFDRPSSPLETRPSAHTSFAEMQEAMAGIDFNPDPSEIQIGGGDSPRLLSTTESHQKSMIAARERTRKAHREGKRATTHNRTLLISHTGREGGKGAKNPKHKGIESFTAPRKFANTGRVHKKSHGSYLHKEEERPVQRPKGKHPMKKELADVSFEVVDHRPSSLSGGVYRQPKKKPKAPRVVAVARPIVSGGYKQRQKRAAASWAAPRIGVGAVPDERLQSGRQSELELELELELEPEPEPQLESGMEPEQQQGQQQQQEQLEQQGQDLDAELEEQQKEQDIDALCARGSDVAEADGRAIDQASATSLRLRARPRIASTPGHLDRSSRVRHAPGARPQRPHEKAWSRHPSRGEWYMANDLEEQENFSGLGPPVSTLIPDDLGHSAVQRGRNRSRNGANQSSILMGSMAAPTQRSKLQQRREAREQRERQRKALRAL